MLVSSIEVPTICALKVSLTPLMVGSRGARSIELAAVIDGVNGAIVGLASPPSPTVRLALKKLIQSPTTFAWSGVKAGPSCSPFI